MSHGRVPAVPMLLVEYPGRVENTDRMLQTMGGADAVDSAWSAGTDIELRMRPETPFCHPIHGRGVQVNYLAARMVKWSTGDTQTEIVGHVETAYRFREMADFQFNVARTDSIVRLRDALDSFDVNYMDSFRLGAELNSNTVLKGDAHMIPPALFSRNETPLDYNFQAARASAASATVSSSSPPSRSQRGAAQAVADWQLGFDAPILHDIPPSLSDRCADKMLHSLRDKLATLFADKPIWLRQSLESKITDENEKRLLGQCLPLVAFYYLSGPWRMMWVRYGYDVKLDVTARQYQLLEVRARQSPLASSTSNAHAPIFQLCDIDDPTVKIVIDFDENIRRQCDSRSGWYYEEHLQVIRRLMRLVLDKSRRVVTEAGIKKQFSQLDESEMLQLRENAFKLIRAAPETKALSANAAKRKVGRALGQQVNDLMKELDAIRGNTESAAAVIDNFSDLEDALVDDEMGDFANDAEYDLFGDDVD